MIGRLARRALTASAATALVAVAAAAHLSSPAPDGSPLIAAGGVQAGGALELGPAHIPPTPPSQPGPGRRQPSA